MVRDTCLDPGVDQNLTTTKTNESARCFGAQSGRERLIINLADNDHGWRDSVFCISGALETAQQRDQGSIRTVWNEEKTAHREMPVTSKVKKWVHALLQIGINFHNWSWLLDPNRPSDPPDVPVFKEESSASTVKRLMEGDVEVNTVSLSGENPRGKVSRGKRINLNPRRAWGDPTWPASL